MRHALILVVVLVAGCASKQRQGDELMDSVMTYNEGVRWERLAAAATRVPPAERDDFVDERDQLAEDLRISDWEIKRVRQRGERRAEIHVKYTWYRDDEGIVHETHAMQRWERRGRAWLIVGEERLRGDEMPGLTDGPEDEGEGEEPPEDSEEELGSREPAAPM